MKITWLSERWLYVVLSRGPSTGFLEREEKREKGITMLPHAIHFIKVSLSS